MTRPVKYQSYSYPEDIKEDRYKYRKVIFTIKAPGASERASVAMEKALEKYNSARDFVVEEASDILGVKANLDANSETNSGTTVGSIILPLPNAFNDSQNHGWTRETGIIGTIGQNLMNTTGNQLANSIGTVKGGGPLATVVNAAGSVGKIAGKIMGDISIDKTLGAISNQTGTRKPIIDPGYFQNYTGSEPRTFVMTFDLVPKNADEANQILMIILKLKQWSSPSKQISGVSLLAPHWFDIELSNPFLSALAKIDRVVLTAINVDYGADGAMQQTADGMPKYMILNMTFQEADMTTQEDYNSKPRKSK